MSHVKVVKVSVFIKQKKKTVISSFTKVGEVGTKRIEIEVNQEKINHISYAYNKEATYSKK